MIFYINASQSPYALDLSTANTQILNLEEVRLVVDSTDGAVLINLPSIAAFPQQNVKIYVTDAGGAAATNNITIVPAGSDTIVGESSAVINANNGFLKLEIGTDGEWGAESSGSGGGGSNIEFLSFSQTFTADEIKALLNDPTKFEELVAPVASNKVPVLVTAKMMMGEGSKFYNNDDARLALNTDEQFAGDAAGIFSVIPPNVLSRDYSGYAIDFSVIVAARPGPTYYSFAGSKPGGGIYLKSDQNYNVTEGDRPVTVFGTYYLITVSS